MVDYYIKLAEENDVKQINDIVNYYIENTSANWSWSPRSLDDALTWYKKHDFGIHPIFVAKAKDKVLGYASLSAFREKEGYWPVAEVSIYLDNDYKGMKIGSKLMDTLLLNARQSKLEAITSWVTSSNKSSIDFHKKYGFEIVGQMSNVGDKSGKRLSVTILQLSVI